VIVRPLLALLAALALVLTAPGVPARGHGGGMGGGGGDHGGPPDGMGPGAAAGSGHGTGAEDRGPPDGARARGEPGIGPPSPAATGRGSMRGAAMPARTGVGPGAGSENDRFGPALLASGLDADALEAALALGFRLRSRERLAALDLQLVTLEPPLGVDPERAARMLTARFPGVVVDFDHAYAPQGTASLETCDDCWPRRLVAWPPAPRCRASGPLALLDGAPRVDHPALAGARLTVHRLADAPATEHATALALLLVGRGIGLVPEAALHAVAVYRSTPWGPRAGVRDLVRGLDLALRHRVRVALMPLAGPPNRLLALALRRARARGLLAVAAAGNGGPYAPPAHPAALPETVAVTAVDRRLAPWPAAGRGPHLDFAAPGVALPLSGADGRPFRASGTSFATPFVAAALALGPAAGFPRPDALLAELARQAVDLGAPGRDPVFGHGLVRPPGPCRRSPATAPPVASSTAAP